jgi:hypothetical protein
MITFLLSLSLLYEWTKIISGTVLSPTASFSRVVGNSMLEFKNQSFSHT